ncbi:hypothetical protein LCGC14_2592740, partial [marine sediment metagenome]
MKAALIRVSLPVLERMLCLNKIKITRVRQTWEQENARSMQLMIEGDGLFEVPEGSPIPEVMLEMEIKDGQIMSSKII